MSRKSIDVAIIGAGPYGLSLASHLSHRGVEHRIFGFPMRSWRQMPPGMYLKSFGFATSIPTPHSHHTLPEYCRSLNLEDFEPIETACFADYGEWFQKRLVPEVEQVQVERLASLANAFQLVLGTGEELLARRVIVAVGLAHFPRIPDVFRSLPPELCTRAGRTAEYLKTAQYAGRDVTVVGAGQSALEAAALLHEGGAHVRILARRDVWWSGRMGERSLRDRLLNPNTVVGPGRKNWVLQHVPSLPHYLPPARRVRLTRNHLGPLGAWWLRDRVDGKVPVLNRTSVLAATGEKCKVRLRVSTVDGGERDLETDHVIAGTGYEPDVDRLPFLCSELAGRIRRIERAPTLSRHFESSVPGLYFVGPIAAFSFGPLVRFVAGSSYTTPIVAKHVKRSRNGTSAGLSRAALV